MCSMKSIKSYTNIWNVKKKLYAVGDTNLPFAVSFSELFWGIGSFFIIMVFSDLPPFSFVHNALIKYIALPVLIAWGVNQKTFDKKKPFSFFLSLFSFLFRAKVHFGYDVVKKKRKKYEEQITAVRRFSINEAIEN